MSLQGPVIFVADCNVPAGQVSLTLPTPAAWMAIVAGGFTVTKVAAGAEVQPPEIAMTLNKPDALGVAFAMTGFWFEETKPFGPVQLYVAPGTVEAVRFNVIPDQSGPLLPAVGDAGGVQTGVAFTDAEFVLSQPSIVAEIT